MSNGTFQMTDEVKMLLEKLPRSVIDVFGDKISIHAVDMVQAQIDREKEFKMLQEENMALRMEIDRLNKEKEDRKPCPEEEAILSEEEAEEA